MSFIPIRILSLIEINGSRMKNSIVSSRFLTYSGKILPAWSKKIAQFKHRDVVNYSLKLVNSFYEVLN